MITTPRRAPSSSAPGRPAQTHADQEITGEPDTGRAVTSAPMNHGGASARSSVLERTWLVIPLFNEAAVVREVIEQARELLPHVVVVDDGSKDDSVAQAQAGGGLVLRHPINLGQGAALQTGIEYVLTRTDAAYIVTFDADGQHRVEDAAAMVKRAEAEGLGFVLGSRFLEGPSPVGWLKRLVLRTAAIVSSRTSGMHLSDAHNGLRVLRRDAAEHIDLRQNRMAHASEIVRQLGATGLPWAEHPVHIAYTDYSRSKGQSLWNSVNILVDLLFS